MKSQSHLERGLGGSALLGQLRPARGQSDVKCIDSLWGMGGAGLGIRTKHEGAVARSGEL
eukprot:3598505-Pleurochrysis_carterae.AAC.1